MDLSLLAIGVAIGLALVPRLTIPHKHHDNLVLEGLYRISQSLT